MICLGWKRLLIVASTAWILVVASFSALEYRSVNIFDQFDLTTPPYTFWEWSKPKNKLGSTKAQNLTGSAKTEESRINNQTPLEGNKLVETAVTSSGTDNSQNDNEERNLVPRFGNILPALLIPIAFIWGCVWSTVWVRNGFRKGNDDLGKGF